jgi:hypothetical protein
VIDYFKDLEKSKKMFKYYENKGYILCFEELSDSFKYKQIIKLDKKSNKIELKYEENRITIISRLYTTNIALAIAKAIKNSDYINKKEIIIKVNNIAIEEIKTKNIKEENTIEIFIANNEDFEYIKSLKI